MSETQTGIQPEISAVHSGEHVPVVPEVNENLGLVPPDEPYEVYTNEPSEIVIGIVGALGTDNGKVCSFLAERLRTYGYECELIRISTVIIPALADTARIPKTHYEKSRVLINLGNEIRRESKNNAVLAIAVAAEIARRRDERLKSLVAQIRDQAKSEPVGKEQQEIQEEPPLKVAYVVSSLKHPDEVAELRKIYSGGFYLFAVHTDREERLKHLSGDQSNIPAKGMHEHEALELIQRDEHEKEPYGQHTRNTFHLADFFLADEKNDDKLRQSVWRCLDLIFGNPAITPTFSEFAMFMAFAASLRSADLSRQVGAVVALGSDILSTGANDCPCPGGGLYWPALIGDRVDDVARGRDFKRGCDSNAIEKGKLIDEISEQFPEDQRQQVRGILEESRIKDITEYGRVVHAEMEALLACARSNVSCRGATLFCTTFPCHNCAKHIIAAGIKQVFYVEPYPKSKALEFHDEAATTGHVEEGDEKVRFRPFIGVGPRQFFDLFSLSLSTGRPIKRKSPDGLAVAWNPLGAVPRVQMLRVAHRRFEELALKYLNDLKRTEE